MLKKPYAATEPVDVNAKVLGHIITTVTRKEVTPIYDGAVDFITYGAILDNHLREFYNSDDGGDLSDITFELSPDAQRILRDSIRNGAYRS